MPAELDPQVRAFLAAAEASPQPPIDTLPLGVARSQFANLTPIFHPPVEVARVLDETTPSGVALRFYFPSAETVLQPAVVYFHGGGWVLGDLDTHDTLCRHLARAAGMVVIAVDYRRAPEHPYPAALEDSCEAFRHIATNSSRWGIAPERIAVAGDSAGGNLAAVVALQSRATGIPRPAFQCLIYPVLDAGCDTTSYDEFAEGYGLTRAKMRFFWKCYGAEGDVSNPLLSPLRATDLSGLPPALIVTAEYDVLRDEGESYAQRLAAHGVPVELVREAGVIHGFIHYAGAIHRGQAVLREIGGKMAAALQAPIR